MNPFGQTESPNSKPQVDQNHIPTVSASMLATDASSSSAERNQLVSPPTTHDAPPSSLESMQFDQEKIEKTELNVTPTPMPSYKEKIESTAASPNPPTLLDFEKIKIQSDEQTRTHTLPENPSPAQNGPPQNEITTTQKPALKEPAMKERSTPPLSSGSLLENFQPFKTNPQTLHASSNPRPSTASAKPNLASNQTNPSSKARVEKSTWVMPSKRPWFHLLPYSAILIVPALAYWILSNTLFSTTEPEELNFELAPIKTDMTQKGTRTPAKDIQKQTSLPLHSGQLTPPFIPAENQKNEVSHLNSLHLGTTETNALNQPQAQEGKTDSNTFPQPSPRIDDDNRKPTSAKAKLEKIDLNEPFLKQELTVPLTSEKKNKQTKNSPNVTKKTKTNSKRKTKPPVKKRSATNTSKDNANKSSSNKPSTLSIVVIPFGKVWIDGKFVGRSPLRKTVEPGKHVVGTGDDHPSHTKQVSVKAGQLKTVYFNLN